MSEIDTKIENEAFVNRSETKTLDSETDTETLFLK